MKNKYIAVIGAGAAGYFAAIKAAQENPSAKVAIYEATNKALAKLLISGGGRCNVTNHCYDPVALVENYPRGSKELRGAFSRFQPQDTVQWFESRGVKLKTESDRRIFPVTDDSQTIADCLINQAKTLGVTTHFKHKLVKLLKVDDLVFDLQFSNSKTQRSSRVILTTGGNRKVFSLVSDLGHSISPPVPSLFSFVVKSSLLEGLSGVSFPNLALQLKFSNGKKFKQQGPVLITHWGLSGPAIIKLSAIAARDLFDSDYKAELTLDFVSEYKIDDIKRLFEDYKTGSPNKLVINTSCFNMPKSFWSKLLDNSRITWANMSKSDLNHLAQRLKSLKMMVVGKGQFKEEFVTCGGVVLKEVNFKTMESKLCSGLYFAGEILDIDGLTGGFNFQSAWTTAWIAGSNC